MASSYASGQRIAGVPVVCACPLDELCSKKLKKWVDLTDDAARNERLLVDAEVQVLDSLAQHIFDKHRNDHGWDLSWQECYDYRCLSTITREKCTADEVNAWYGDRTRDRSRSPRASRNRSSASSSTRTARTVEEQSTDELIATVRRARNELAQRRAQ